MQGKRASTICETLGDRVAGMVHADLPDEIVAEVRLCLLDFFGAVLAAPLEGYIDQTSSVFGTGPARLIHDGRAISVAGAAYAHGFLSTVEDIDDSHALASGMHLSATVFPVALALAQMTPVSQRDFVRACVAGYEVGGRLVRAMDRGLRERGFHATGAIGPFAAAATAGAMLNMSAGELTHAMGIAASGAGGLFAFFPTGAATRHTHGANACVVGLMAALAARSGVDGPLHAFEGPDGFIGPYSERCDSSFINRAAPSSVADFELLNAYHKRFAACGHAIPAITAALELRARLDASIDEIERIDVHGYRASAALTNFPASSTSEAKFSLPIICALALRHGDVWRNEMTEARINDPEIRSLSAKVRVHHDARLSDAFPGKRMGRLDVALRGGRNLSCETDAPIGMPGNRLGFDDIEAKFLSLAVPVIGTNEARAIVSRCAALSEADDRFAVF